MKQTAAEKWSDQIDREDPRYTEGARAAAAGAAPDMRQGSAWMWGWVEERFKEARRAVTLH